MIVWYTVCQCTYFICILSFNTMWFPQLKRGLTFNNFTQPQSISHFSSTRPQWELLKRDSNSKSLISHRAGVNPSGLPWVSDTQTHTYRHALCYHNFTNNWHKVLVNFTHVNSSCTQKLLNILPFPCHPFKSSLSQGNNGRNVWPLEPVSGAIERLAAGSDAVN